MGKNRGKQFESHIQEAFEKVPGVSVDRLHDQTTGYLGASNICDFIVYKKPYEYYIECKSVHGNTLSIHSIPKPDKKGVLHGFYGNISDTQWEGLLEKSKIPGVTAGIMCWWVDLDETWFIPIQILEEARNLMHAKSINVKYPYRQGDWFCVRGYKKRVFFEYYMDDLLRELEDGKKTKHTERS